MLNFIYNLYYRFYRFLIYLGQETTPRYNAVLLLSILTILNFISFAILLILTTKRMLILDLNKMYLFLIGLVIIGINSYVVFGKKRYLEIERTFGQENKSMRVRNNYKAIGYVILTVIIFIFSLVYLYNNPVQIRQV